MSSIANPAKPKTSNGQLSAAGWGKISVRVMSIGHGMSVVNSGSTARKNRRLIITRATSGSFGVEFLCTSYEEYLAFGNWIKGYGRALVENAAKVGPIRVMCPARDFDKVAIPNGISFGDTALSHTYPISMLFLGSRDPVPLTPGFVSSFSLPRGGDISLPYFYPGGSQLSGDKEGIDMLFDLPPEVSPLPSLRPLPPGTGTGGGGRVIVQ